MRKWLMIALLVNAFLLTGRLWQELPARAQGQDPGPGSDSYYYCADSNGDGQIMINDAINILNFLFLGGKEPECQAESPTPLERIKALETWRDDQADPVHSSFQTALGEHADRLAELETLRDEHADRLAELDWSRAIAGTYLIDYEWNYDVGNPAECAAMPTCQPAANQILVIHSDGTYMSINSNAEIPTGGGNWNVVEGDPDAIQCTGMIHGDTAVFPTLSRSRFTVRFNASRTALTYTMSFEHFAAGIDPNVPPIPPFAGECPGSVVATGQRVQVFPEGPVACAAD